MTDNKEAHTAENYRGNVDEVLEDFKIKESMINRLSNLINRNRSAAKISQVLCSNDKPSQ